MSDKLDTTNLFVVGGQGNKLRVLNLPKLAAGITSDEALNLAAYLVALAMKPCEDFIVLLDAIEGA